MILSNDEVGVGEGEGGFFSRFRTYTNFRSELWG